MKTKVVAQARLGNTQYLAEDDGVDTVKITRINSDGRKEIWVPVFLIAEYVAQCIKEKRRQEESGIMNEVVRMLGIVK